MANRWTVLEENNFKKELFNLYIKKNKTIGQIGKILGIAESTVFQRLKRLGIKSQPHLKENYLQKRGDVCIPKYYTKDLAEFFGIMLGDGHLSHFQVVVCLGNKEEKYSFYVRALIQKIFKTNVKISIRKDGYRDVYLGSTQVTSWLLTQGLVFNKVKEQVDVPVWIFSETRFMKSFLRGFFDTDGSVYKLKFGMQVSLTNHSFPILLSLHEILFKLGYNPSEISASKIYLTRLQNVRKFFSEIGPKNPKHLRRFKEFINMRRSDSGYSRRL